MNLKNDNVDQAKNVLSKATDLLKQSQKRLEKMSRLLADSEPSYWENHASDVSENSRVNRLIGE